MSQTVTPFLMFTGNAAEALDCYVAAFADAGIDLIERYPPDEPGGEGRIKRAEFHLGELRLRCFDSPIEHAFTFTPAFSLFVDCADADELEDLFGKLSDGGGILMPPGDYGFSQRFCWINDRFGVSWQLNLP